MGQHAGTGVGYRHMGGGLAKDPRRTWLGSARDIRRRIRADGGVAGRSSRVAGQVRGSVAVTEKTLSRAPFLWALGYVGLFGMVFSTIAWSLGDTYSHLARPALASWAQAVTDAFTSGREYRPLFDLAIKASYETAGTWLPFYQALVMLLFAALLLLVVWLCRPVGPRRALAACVAISCVSALHTSRILFGFWPLNHYAFVMVCILLTIAVALAPATRRSDWLFGLLALVAMLGLELGALIVPLSIVLWWFGAPGIGRRGVLSVAAGAVVYLVVRLTLAEYSGESLYADTGFIFQTVDAASLRARFGDSPWLLWIYNVGSTFLTIVASEPREGVFSFVESLLRSEEHTSELQSPCNLVC